MQEEEKEKLNKLIGTLLTTDGRGTEAKRQALIALLGGVVSDPTEYADLIKSWKFKNRREA